MTRNRKAQAVTFAVLFAALGIAVARKPALKIWRDAPPTDTRIPQDPQDTIYAMMDAARAGDVKAYLACYTGPMEAALRQALADATEPGFAQYLRDSNATVKGIAVSDPQRMAELEAKVRVEYVYEERNQAQTMYLEKGSNGWKISRTDEDERVKTRIKYGTPVK